MDENNGGTHVAPTFYRTTDKEIHNNSNGEHSRTE
jgi:hypothetical protein